MKTTRVVMERAISDGAFFVAEKEIDQDGNVMNVFLTIDGQTVAKRANGKWKALIKGWRFRECADGAIEWQRPDEAASLN